ncbi:MAG: adenylosuccinate lyase [Deltaproteobacteria bacterium]|nr:MAG: adenylosuccinate lyase [Deltaproteobacteria bacterium]
MVPRYTKPEMAAIWTDENRFKKWLDVEVYACEGWNKLGKIPDDSLKVIQERAAFEVDRILEIEEEVKHDVIAFLTNVAEHVGPDSRFIHMGMTSSDVLDTALAMQLVEASDLLIAQTEKLTAAIGERAEEFKMVPQMGRSHGIHAEPVTFGIKLASWYDEMTRNLSRLARAREAVAVGMISGAVGTFANIEPSVEEHVCARAGLRPAKVSTQVISRDHHAEFFSLLALVATSIEKFSVEIRHMQRTEVLEAEEFFSKGQKGSSAMPHKRNPIATENLTGCARLMRSYAQAALENVALWHERDISHSSVERVIGPDATILLHYMLVRFTGVIKNLMVYPQNMQKNIDITGGLPNSQRLMLALVGKGVTREEAYAMVQRNAMRVWTEGADYKELLKADADVSRLLSEEEIDEAFDIGYHLKHVDTIFSRVFGK